MKPFVKGLLIGAVAGCLLGVAVFWLIDTYKPIPPAYEQVLDILSKNTNIQENDVDDDGAGICVFEINDNYYFFEYHEDAPTYLRFRNSWNFDPEYFDGVQRIEKVLILNQCQNVSAVLSGLRLDVYCESFVNKRGYIDEEIVWQSIQCLDKAIETAFPPMEEEEEE